VACAALNPISERPWPWLQPSLETQFGGDSDPLGPAEFAASNQCDEDDAGKSGVLHERQDGGSGGGAAGPSPKVQEAREEEEEVPGPRSR